jgi:hypothetical protein
MDDNFDVKRINYLKYVSILDLVGVRSFFEDYTEATQARVFTVDGSIYYHKDEIFAEIDRRANGHKQVQAD